MRCTLAIIFLLLAACGGRDPIVRGGEDVLVGDHPSLMGELEEQARVYLLDMAFVLESFADAPETAVDRMRAFLSVNGGPMLDNARALDQRFRALDAVVARIYEAQLAAYLGDAMRQWRDSLNRFRREHPEEGRLVAEIVAEVDR